MVFTCLQILRQGYTIFAGINRYQRFKKSLGLTYTYFYLWWRDPEVKTRCTKILLTNDSTKNVLTNLSKQLSNSGMTFTDGIKVHDGEMSFTFNNTKHTFYVKVKENKILRKLAEKEHLSPHNCHNTILIETGEYSIQPFRKAYRIKRIKRDFQKVIKMIEELGLSIVQKNEIINLDMVIPSRKIKKQKVHRDYHDYKVNFDEKGVQVSGVESEDYKDLIIFLVCLWWSEMHKAS